MKHIAAYCPNLVALDIRGCWRVSDLGIAKIGEYCKFLRVLNIMDCRDVSEASLMRLRTRGVMIDRPLDPLSRRLNPHRGVIPVEPLYGDQAQPFLRLQV